MRINRILQYQNTTFKSAEKKQREKKKELSTKEKAVYGAAGITALALATYFVVKGRKNPKELTKTADTVTKPLSAETLKQFNLDDFVPFFEDKTNMTKSNFAKGSTVTYQKIEGNETYRDILVFNKQNELTRRINDYRNTNGQMWSRVYKGDEAKITLNPDKMPKGRYDSEFLVKEFSGDAKKAMGRHDISENYERLTRVAYPNGNAKTHQGFFSKNKLHEYNIYYEKFDNNLGCFDKLHQSQPDYIVKYNYGYKNGKIAGIAKQEVLKDNNWHGVYRDNGFDAFPHHLDLKDGKGFKEIKEDLYIRHPEFDPEKF